MLKKLQFKNYYYLYEKNKRLYTNNVRYFKNLKYLFSRIF